VVVSDFSISTTLSLVVLAVVSGFLTGSGLAISTVLSLVVLLGVSAHDMDVCRYVIKNKIENNSINRFIIY
jgi:hypothetical protein